MARPLAELVDPGWARALAPVGDQIGVMGGDQAANTLRSNAGTAQVWGVTRLPRLRSVERRQLLFVAGPGDRQLSPEVRRCLLELRSGLARRAVDVIVDVDPEWFS